MTKRNARRKRENNLIRTVAGAVAGVGLILLGVALFLFLRSPQEGAGAEPSSELSSVVPMAVEYPAPELSLTDMDGQASSLADYRNDVLLVNNWATWCPPCKAEMPVLESYYEAHAAQGFMLVGIEAGESREEVQPFVQDYGLKFAVWLDPQNAALKAFRNGNLPNSYVIDRSGTVRYAWTGPIDRAALEKFVTPLLSEN